jgi:hypothetical protein
VCVCVCAVFVCASLQPLIHQLSNGTTGELMFPGLNQSMVPVGVPECRPSAGPLHVTVISLSNESMKY